MHWLGRNSCPLGLVSLAQALYSLHPSPEFQKRGIWALSEMGGLPEGSHPGRFPRERELMTVLVTYCCIINYPKT